MPSRPVVVLILTFWSATLGLAFYRDVWPRLAATGPPPLSVDLGDEASQLVPVRWAVVRGDQRIGRLTTRMAYVDADDTFQFIHKYTLLQFDFPGIRPLGVPDVRIAIPDLTTTTRVTRTGSLREQTMDGKLVLQFEKDGSYRTIAEAEAKVAGRVEDGVFRGHCDLRSPFLNVKRPLDPVPVPEGQALTPLQPLNRIASIQPGQRWFVHEINPLDEALSTLLQQEFGKHGFALPEKEKERLLAEVGSDPQVLRWDGGEASCWVIEYRGREARAKTWVRVEDGKVLRQEATLNGERIALERED